MSLKQWEKKVLEAPGAPERVQEIEDELRLAAGLTALREQAGLTQRELAERIGVSQPRIAAIERSHNRPSRCSNSMSRHWEATSS
jgi:DNA-binding XRE family transcriptional regulator